MRRVSRSRYSRHLRCASVGCDWPPPHDTQGARPDREDRHTARAAAVGQPVVARRIVSVDDKARQARAVLVIGRKSRHPLVVPSDLVTHPVVTALLDAVGRGAGHRREVGIQRASVASAWGEHGHVRAVARHKTHQGDLAAFGWDHPHPVLALGVTGRALLVRTPSLKGLGTHRPPGSQLGF